MGTAVVERTTDQLAHRDQLSMQPWDRKPEETVQCYARFLLYRDQPTGERSLSKLGISKTLATRWSARWAWVARVRAWDDYLITLNADLTIAQALSVRARALRFGKAAVDKAVTAIEQLPVKRVSSRDAIELAQAGDKLARTALGLSDSTAPASPATSVAVTFAQGFAPAWMPAPVSPSVTDTNRDSAALVTAPPQRTLLAERVGASERTPTRTHKRTRTPRSTIEGTG